MLMAVGETGPEEAAHTVLDVAVGETGPEEAEHTALEVVVETGLEVSERAAPCCPSENQGMRGPFQMENAAGFLHRNRVDR